jgi:hypothetical protein
MKWLFDKLKFLLDCIKTVQGFIKMLIVIAPWLGFGMAADAAVGYYESAKNERAAGKIYAKALYNRPAECQPCPTCQTCPKPKDCPASVPISQLQIVCKDDGARADIEALKEMHR